MTGEVTFLKLVFPFQTHTLNVRAWYEINSSEAELATLKEHSYSKLNVAWTEIFCICFVNCLCLVLFPCLVGLAICAQKGPTTEKAEKSRSVERPRRACAWQQCALCFDRCPRIFQPVITSLSLSHCATAPSMANPVPWREMEGALGETEAKVTGKGHAADSQPDFKAESCTQTTFLCCACTTRCCFKVHWNWIKPKTTNK